MDLKIAFQEVCDFCGHYPAVRGGLPTDDPRAQSVIARLKEIAGWLAKRFTRFDNTPINIIVSEGTGAFPRVPWICLLPAGQRVSDGIYVGICFGKGGNGAVAGCMQSASNPKGLKTFTRASAAQVPAIDVDGIASGTRYNNVFANPLEIPKETFDPEVLSNHIAESLRLALRKSSSSVVPRCWIFQGNPNQFDLDRYLRSRGEIRWQVTEHANLIKIGDKVLIWRSGTDPGVVAECSVGSGPSAALEEDASDLYLTKPGAGQKVICCKLTVLDRYPSQPIPWAHIKQALPELGIIKAPQSTNFAVTNTEYSQILSLKPQRLDDRFSEQLRRYWDEKIIFSSSFHKVRYGITALDETGVSVERLDANEPQRVTFAQAEKLARRVEEEGPVAFTELDHTSAVRNTVLQAEQLALTADQAQIVFLPDKPARLQNLLQAIATMNMANPLYKPAMLLCVLDGIDIGDLPANRITFDWVAPRFIAKMRSLGKEVTEQQAAHPFYHLTGDLFWLHAVQNLKELMKDGGEGPTAARMKIKYALLKDTYWHLLQDPSSRAAVRRQLTAMTLPQIPPDQIVPDAETAINATGFLAAPGQIRRFVSALASKPFVILTGNSGTGKTKLAELFAQWLCGNEASRFALVPIGADWTDNRNVLGFVNHLRSAHLCEPGEEVARPLYQSTRILDLLLEASRKENEGIPFFIILDEMNLSHVERYFADFLSALESKQAKLLLHREGRPLPRKPTGSPDVPEELTLPRNLFVIGTVNVDETTYMFSPKVLDRANVLEFRVEADTPKQFLQKGGKPIAEVVAAPLGYAQAFLNLSRRARGLASPALESPPVTSLDECHTALIDLFALMQQRHQEFAFRPMAEILRYLAVDYEFTADKTAWDWQAAMDAQILQKILPKLHGSKRKIGSLLAALAAYCEKAENYATAEDLLKNESKAESYPAASDRLTSPPRFKESYRKLGEMLAAVRRDQFVSYIQ